jgi:protein TonB
VAGAGNPAKPRVFHARFDQAPHKIPTGVIPCPEIDPVVIRTDTVANGITGAPQGTTNGRAISDLVTLYTPPVLDPPKAPTPRTPVHVGSIQESKLIYRPDPVYPTLAIAAHVSGTVILEAVIDEDGNVTNLKVLKGHPLLNDAAIQTVSQWKYSPTIQNGEPVQVMATVSVIFRIR